MDFSADIAETLYGDPFALIPSQALEGWRGITRWRPPQGAAAAPHPGGTLDVVVAGGAQEVSVRALEGPPAVEAEVPRAPGRSAHG